MKIIKFEKLKNNKYKITLSNSKSVILYDDIILKYGLLTKKYILEEEINNIIKANDNYEIYYEIIKFINKKLRSEKEIRDKYIEYDINDKIDKLKKSGYIDDERFAKSFIHDEVNLKNYGPYKIKKDLEKHNIDAYVIDNILDEYNNEFWTMKINNIINKYIKINKSDSEYIFKMKIKNKLINMGYDINLINDSLLNINIDDSNIYLKEYEKIKKKYSKKYNGEILEYKIKEYLYKKGFKSE